MADTILIIDNSELLSLDILEMYICNLEMKAMKGCVRNGGYY